jgi:hypothetical protein
MRAILCVTAITLLLVPVSGSADRIALYSTYGNCNLNLVNDITWQFFVFHESTSGATDSDFRIAFDWGSGGGTVLFFSTPYADGPYSWQSGQTLSYGECKTGAFYAADLMITGSTNAPCEAFAYVLDASARDCTGTWQSAVGGTLTIDGNESCPCEEVVPTDVTSWGRIKSLYR